MCQPTIPETFYVLGGSCLVGAASGYLQLWPRFKYAPYQLWLSASAIGYLLLHVVVPAAAFYISKENALLPLTEKPVLSALTLGFGSMTILRLNLSGGNGNSIGPAEWLRRWLDAAGQATNDNYMKMAMERLTPILRASDYSRVLLQLPLLCMGSPGSNNEDSLKRVLREATKIQAEQGGDFSRCMRVAILLIPYCSLDVIVAGLNCLNEPDKGLDETTQTSTIQLDSLLQEFKSR